MTYIPEIEYAWSFGYRYPSTGREQGIIIRARDLPRAVYALTDLLRENDTVSAREVEKKLHILEARNLGRVYDEASGWYRRRANKESES